jgi:hypothetical protein
MIPVSEWQCQLGVLEGRTRLPKIMPTLCKAPSSASVSYVNSCPVPNTGGALCRAAETSAGGASCPGHVRGVRPEYPYKRVQRERS